jgi:GTP pyrophosphokinase
MNLDDVVRAADYLDEKGRGLLDKAFEFAQLAHSEQRRRTGEPYVEHPGRVAEILAELRMDAETLSAALLHDVPEDTPFTLKEIDKNFGREIRELVEGVTKLARLRAKQFTEEEQFETFQRMFIAMAKDMRVVLIKLADRLDNMRTINGISPEKRYAFAKETLDIFAPLADRLGIGTIKGELEDLAFPLVYPEEYKRTVEVAGENIKRRKKTIEKIQRKLLKEVAAGGIKILDVHGRVKHLFTLWRKLKEKKNWDIKEVFDLVALRVIVKSVTDCYGTLGVIHKLWRPVPGRIKDYIATPKTNGYQSLHTTVFTPDGIVEIQIRTPEMHEQAERGIAAHWVYDEKKEALTKIPKWKTAWIHELAKSIREGADFKTLKLDFFTNQIFVFTPKGDIIDLPEGSTPIDFAYAVHTDIGNQAVGAKVNGRLVKFNFVLQSGDVVEILVNPKSIGPKRDWLNFVKTSQARTAIKHHLLHQAR